MTQDDFYAAKIIENDGWEFCGVADDGDMIFSRLIGGVLFSAHVSVDR
jgi:hypothetical protein